MTREPDTVPPPAELALLPSPVLGPNVWQPVADRLVTLGRRVHTPAWSGPLQDPDDVVSSLIAALPRDRPLVLVPHSNAGLYVPILVARLGIVGAVFVDAGLPPSTGDVALASASFYGFLETRADDAGLLLPWTRWWPPDEPDVFPDALVRARVEEQARRLPLSYFRHRVSVPRGWDELPCAYLAFGSTYAEERSGAVARGWPTRTLGGRHLHMLVDPNGVADAIIELMDLLGLG